MNKTTEFCVIYRRYVYVFTLAGLRRRRAHRDVVTSLFIVRQATIFNFTGELHHHHLWWLYFVGHWRIETRLSLDWQFRIEEMTHNINRVGSLVLGATRTNWTVFFFIFNLWLYTGVWGGREKVLLMSHEDESTSVELKWWSQVSARYCCRSSISFWDY